MDPDWIGGGGSPIPFAKPDYVTYEYIAWEDEEDGYAFRTRVYPVSLDDKRVLEIRDSYCWKFISRKIRDEFSEAWKEITEEECKIITEPLRTDIFVIFPPESGLGETELDMAAERIAAEFYNEYVKESGCRLEVHIWETYTKEDFLKIEPEKSEQYGLGVNESEYEDKDWIPVNIIRRTKVKIPE